MNVLLTCVGLRVDVVQAFRDAVERRGEGGVVVGTDMQELAPAAHFCDRFERMPIATDPAYADRLLELAERHDVRCVVPCSEFDLIVLADTRRRFRALGAEVFIPDPDADAPDRRQAGDGALPGRPRHRPRRAPSRPTSCRTTCRFPVLVKMREGMGSNHIHRCQDRRELEFFLGYARVASMVQEVCDGPEFSIDLLCDLDGRCLEAIPRTMIQSKGGEQIKGTTIADPRARGGRPRWSRRRCRCGASAPSSASARRPGESRCKLRKLPAAIQNERDDHGGVPQHRRRVGEEEFMMTVQNAQTPGRQNQ